MLILAECVSRCQWIKTLLNLQNLNIFNHLCDFDNCKSLIKCELQMKKLSKLHLTMNLQPKNVNWIKRHSVYSDLILSEYRQNGKLGSH